MNTGNGRRSCCQGYHLEIAALECEVAELKRQLGERTMVERARTLIENSNRYRFFRGNFYNTDADKFMVALREFLEDYINGQTSQKNN